MKERYIALMERVLSAYSDAHIIRYFNEVKENGLTEHGFPRLTANIDILIAHGRRHDLLPLFLEMMEFCCKNIPTVKAANDFSVREIVCCLWELEKSGVVSREDAVRWRAYLSEIEIAQCYDVFATSPTDSVRNWALFTAVSEFFRQTAGLCHSEEFIELQLLQQMQWLDENGMYCDKSGSENHQPMMYDVVPRGLYVLLLDRGYCGKYRDEIDAQLKKANLLGLSMQSPRGEMAFGGRSNQFLHNEAWLCAHYEYEAKRYAREGNLPLVSAFKSAVDRALAVLEEWVSRVPIRHIKNCFPTETCYGCEAYAYFDKYMITAASFLYAAYTVCDDSITYERVEDLAPCTVATSAHFHKLFVKCGGYGLEFDTDADPTHDANGLGRVHRVGAPSTVCISCPCPAIPGYTVDIDEPASLSACSAIRTEDGWCLGAESKASYEVIAHGTSADAASATLRCHFDEEKSTTEHYRVDESGVSILVKGGGEVAYVLPAFCFDGTVSPSIEADTHTLTVSYRGWVCKYTTDGCIEELRRIFANRNGHYRAFVAVGQNALQVKIEICKA